MNKLQNDTKFIQKCYYIGQFLHICPNSLKNKYLQCVLYSLVTVSYICFVAFSLKERQKSHLVLLSVQIFIDYVNTIIQALMIISVFYSAFWNSIYWLNLKNLLSQLDEEMKIDKVLCKPLFLLSQVIFITVFYFPTNIVFIHNLLWNGYLNGYYSNFFGNIYEYFLLIFVCNIVLALNKRIKIIISNTHKITHMDCENKKMDLLRKQIKLFHLCNEIVKNFNKIFGFTLFWFFQNTAISILSSLNFAIYEMHKIKSFEYVNLTTIAMCTCFYVVSALLIILSCDATEKSGNEFSIILHRCQENVSESRLELFLLTKCVEKCKLKFSAAGFHKLNTSIVISLISSVTSYFIIMVQFNMVTN